MHVFKLGRNQYSEYSLPKVVLPVELMIEQELKPKHGCWGLVSVSPALPVTLVTVLDRSS